MNSSTSTSSSIRCGAARGWCGSSPNGGLTSVAHALDRRGDLAFSTRGGHRMDLPSLVQEDRQLGHPSSDRREDRQVHLSSDRREDRSSSDRREDRSSSDRREGLACWVPVDRLSLDRGGRACRGQEGHRIERAFRRRPLALLPHPQTQHRSAGIPCRFL